MLKLERNKLCPCGSGRKYKKCCLNEVDEQYMQLKKADHPWLSPDLLKAMSLVTGLKTGIKETAPDLSQMEEAVEQINKCYFIPGLDDKKPDDYLYHLNSVFVDLLTKDAFFQKMRLDLNQGLDLLAKAEKKIQEIDDQDKNNKDNKDNKGNKENKEAKAAAFTNVLREWLATHIDQRKNDWFAWQLMKGLRQRSYSLEERASLLFNLHVTLSEVRAEDNPFWEGFLRVVLQESYDALNQMEDLVGVGDDGLLAMEKGQNFDMDKINDLMKQNPTFRFGIEKKISEATGSILEMFSKGKLELDVPPYTVFSGLLAMQNILQDTGTGQPPEETGVQDAHKLLDKVNFVTSHPQKDTILKAISKQWLSDYGLFAQALYQNLEQWLNTKGKEGLESEREKVEQCMAVLGSGHEVKLSFSLYLFAVVSFFNMQDSVLVLDSQRIEKSTGVKGDMLFTREGMERYARLLEEESNSTAAEHVRKYKEQLAEKSG